MRLYNTTKGVVVEDEGYFFLSKHTDWDTFVNRRDLHFEVKRELQKLASDYDYKAYTQHNLLPPVGSQEIWAAGVTYLRSKTARMEEAQAAGGGDFYDRVYAADRPELFFKSTPGRVRGHRQPIRIRRDATWNVPEPELTLFVNTHGQIAGYTIGNDVSSRDIEGENPLYLPQAKTYDGSAALGPCIWVADEPLSPDTKIRIEILRQEQMVFGGSVELRQMKRTFTELVEYLRREMSFPAGCFLMTGTGIVPPDDFSLEAGDEVRISIDNIGTLSNTVERRNALP